MNKRLLILLLITTCVLHLNACSESTTVRNNNTNFNDQSTNNSSATTPDINQVITEFVQSIKEVNHKLFQDIISVSGLVIIRSFSSGYGNRGKDVRFIFPSSSIPEDLQFKVEEEEPIILHNFFSTSSKKASLEEIESDYHNELNFSFSAIDSNEPSIQDIIDICSELVSSSVDSNQYSPKIFFVGNDEVVLTESSLVADFPIGVWAVFVKENDGYKLRAIIELI